MKQKILFLLLTISLSFSSLAKQKDVFLFTYFMDNGVAGVYLAISYDGMHFNTVNP